MRENLHHILFRICWYAGSTALAVGGDVQGFVVVEEFEDVAWGRGVDDTGGNELVHCFVVGGVGGVVDEAGAAGVDCAGDEGHADGALVRDSLEGAD